MRAAFALLIALCSVASAGERIVVMTGDDLSSALELSLSSRHVGVATAATPEGALRLDRAAAAQHTAMASDAGASVWIDAGDVCVVSADGVYFRQAPLPANTTPRVFAAIATSLLDELLAPPEAYNLAVNVDVRGTPVATAAPVVSAAPVGAQVSRVVAVDEIDPNRWKHTLVEFGPVVSAASYGMELELAFPVLPNLRVGVLGGVNHLYKDLIYDLAGTMMYDAALEVRYVGSGTTHFDAGVAAGLINSTALDYGTNINDTGGFAGVRLSYVKEYAATAVSFSVAPMVLFDFSSQGRDKNFGLMSSLRLQLPI
jgi:hypothetical protein